jgi:AcrR family transcriptional regulator
MGKRKKKIIAEATFLLALKKGLGNISIKEIQEISGLTAGSIYHNFKNKDEILHYIANVYIMDNFYQYKQVIKSSSDSFIKRIENIFYSPRDLNEQEYNIPNNNITAEINHKEYFRLFFRSVHQPPKYKLLFHKLHEESFNFYRELVQEAIENKEIKNDIGREALTMFIHTVFTGYLYLGVFYLDLPTEKYMDANLKTIDEMIKKQLLV